MIGAQPPHGFTTTSPQKHGTQTRTQPRLQRAMVQSPWSVSRL